MHEDPKDPKKDPEEELKRLIEELETYGKKKQNAVSYAFLLHRNYAIHLLLSLVVNFLMAVTVIGLGLALNHHFLTFEFEAFMLAIILLTLIENLVKILLFKYALKVMLYSLGLLSWVVQILILYGITVIFGDAFAFLSVWDLVVFSVMFTVMRFILSVYIRRYMFQRKHIFMGGRKK